MSEKTSNTELINLLLENEDTRLEEEEMMHLLVQNKVSKNVNSVASDNLTFGQRMADRIASFAGSWPFIIIFLSCLVLWITVNSLILAKAFDAYPFILLNLILSCIAAIQAPIIMMSQNRQEEKDRLRSLNDYKTNLKSEIIIEDLHRKLDKILETQEMLLQGLAKDAAQTDNAE
ncbi:MAG: DUF1003 domain-containing protein [Clostridia bacterium]|nr:DUF1003 domain-containing protein [Clostridia bacterium]